MKAKRMHTKRLKLDVPDQELPLSKFLTESGTFQDGNLRLNKNGLQIISTDGASEVPGAKIFDLQFALEDLETIKVIGKGSGGVVKLAKHKESGELFALKEIQLNIEDQIRKQIVQELKINHISHCPRIVLWYQSFYHNGTFSLALEYMDRGSVADILKQVHTIAEAELSGICKQVLEGLVYLHNERHIIHRDIKPSNLLVNKKGEVKVSDFGVSAMLQRSREERITVIGTCNYMSPERIMNCKYDYKSDIWSLGLVMLECAIGYFPYKPSGQEGWSNIFELLEAIIDQPPPAPEDRFSSEFRSFLSACLQKNPLKRPSAAELLSHSFVKKYEHQNMDLAVLVGNLAPPHTEGYQKMYTTFRASEFLVRRIT